MTFYALNHDCLLWLLNTIATINHWIVNKCIKKWQQGNRLNDIIYVTGFAKTGPNGTGTEIQLTA